MASHEPRSVFPARHPDIAWKDGEIIHWDDCVLHVRSQAGFFGANIFEGLRAYWNDETETLYLFRLDEHLTRLEQSMRIMRMTPRYDRASLSDAALLLMSRCGFREHAQINLSAYFGFSSPGEPLQPTDDTGAHITAIPLPQSPKLRDGIDAAISSWRRLPDDVMPPRIKIASNYQNSRLAQNEARLNGYDVAILLNSRGKVSEGPAACLFMVRHGRLVTPPTAADILESITRETVITLARKELGLVVDEREIDRTELLVADEVFLCGSLVEIVPVNSIDRIAIGSGQPGDVTRGIQDLYFRVAQGKVPRYSHWCTAVPSQADIAATDIDASPTPHTQFIDA